MPRWPTGHPLHGFRLNSRLLEAETDTYVKVYVDDDKAVKESNESNNLWQGYVQCLR